VRGTLLDEAARRELRPRDLACTLLVAVVGPSSAIFAQLGDGAIVVGNGVERRCVFWPEPAEYANVTDFLSDDHYANALRIRKTDELIVELAVLTDGLQRLALDFALEAPHAAFFTPLFRSLGSAEDASALAEPFEAFLDSAAINARTDDDKTLLLAVRATS